MKKKFLALSLAVLMVVSLLPMTAFAASFSKSEISNPTLYESGCLKTLDVTIQAINEGYTPAYGRIGVHTEVSSYSYTNQYISSNNCTTWPETINDPTLVGLSTAEFLWTDCQEHTVTVQFEDGEIPCNQDKTYVVHLWTRAEIIGIYPDHTFGNLVTNANGKLFFGDKEIVINKETITNGTPESAKETNHGYITVDETAAEGETVTVTVKPNEGYQLKSLTCTPDTPTISTIADVLATVEGFPASEDQTTPPSSAWVADVQNSRKCYAYTSSSGNTTVLLLRIPAVGEIKGTYTFFPTTTEVAKGNNYYTATNSYGSLTFNMENGILTSFKFTADPSKPNAADYVGTYTPANTPSPRLKPITPAKQTDGTYQFTMPGYAVTVTAEFEAVGGTPSGKTLPYSFDFETDMVAEGWTNIDADGDGQDWISGTNKYGDEGWGVAGSRCAISQSYENDNFEAFDADNRLFSPAITIPAGGATVSWYEQSQDPAYPDFYEVYVSETNTEIDLSEMTKIFSGFAANPWTQRSVELEAAEYAGKTVYIAFRHHCYDCYMLEIDDFAVEAVAPAHTHAFTYTANNGKITATCVDGCDDGYDTNPLTLTLTAPASLVYDGNVKAFTFADGEAAAWTGAGLELPTIYYYEKKDYPFYMGIDSAPTDAGGDYMVEITVNKKAARIYFTIDKATPYIKTEPAPNDIEYGKKLSDSTLFGGYVQVSSTDSTQVGGLFEWTNPDTVPGIDDSEITEYDVTFTPADTNNYNTVSCKITVKVNHTHAPVLAEGQAPTEKAAGFKDYYECECGDLFEDATGLIPIENLESWKSSTGNGYIAPLVHTVTPVNGQDATDTEAGHKAYYECKNCGKYYEDATGLIEITNIDGWKAEGGDGYLAPLHGTDDNHDHICDYCDRQVSEHKGVLVEGTAATLESAGFKSYYKCDCGKFFEDATCNVEITDLDAWKALGGNGYIAKLEEDPKIPQTGDTSNMTFWVMLMALSSIGLCACIVLGKKRKKEQ